MSQDLKSPKIEAMNSHKDADTSDRAESCPEAYEKMAGSYHAKRFGSRRGRYDLSETMHHLQYLMQELNLGARTLNVLDVACGTGKVSIPLAEWGANVTCFDASQGMLQQCCQRAVDNQVEHNCLPKRGNAEQLPFETGWFDFAISTRFLHLFPLSSYPIFINEMIRVVRPDGYVVVEIKNRYYGLVAGLVRYWRQTWQGKIATSSMSLSEIQRLQNQLVCGRITRISGCQLPKAQWFPSESYAAAVLRRLARTVLSPISFFYFVVIRKE